jgi:hypothetical protein
MTEKNLRGYLKKYLGKPSSVTERKEIPCGCIVELVYKPGTKTITSRVTTSVKKCTYGHVLNKKTT